MGKINWGRVVLGGLLAGVVLNVVDWLTYGVWLKADMAAAMQALGKQPGAMDSAIPLWVALDFVSGIGLLWVYAAIRPRNRAPPTTESRCPSHPAACRAPASRRPCPPSATRRT